jgi:threonine synthase
VQAVLDGRLHNPSAVVGVLAAAAARAGIRSVVLIPSNLERQKILTTAAYGGTLVAVEGNEGAMRT